METIEECREIALDIKSIKERIEEITLSVTAPKVQVTDDMPKASGNGENMIEKYVERKEKLELQLKQLQKELSDKWTEMLIILNQNGAKKDEMQILFFRYVQAMSWKECGNILGWNTNKVFRIHRKSLKLCIKKTL